MPYRPKNTVYLISYCHLLANKNSSLTLTFKIINQLKNTFTVWQTCTVCLEIEVQMSTWWIIERYYENCSWSQIKQVTLFNFLFSQLHCLRFVTCKTQMGNAWKCKTFTCKFCSSQSAVRIRSKQYTYKSIKNTTVALLLWKIFFLLFNKSI